MKRLRSCVLVALSLAAGQATAETLPLRRGAYVGVGTGCKAPPNAELRTYDGNGLGSSKANDCRTRVVSRQGNVYRIAQDCRQYGGPNLGRATEQVTVRIDGPDRYTDLTGGAAERFRLCPGLEP